MYTALLWSITSIWGWAWGWQVAGAAELQLCHLERGLCLCALVGFVDESRLIQQQPWPAAATLQVCMALPGQFPLTGTFSSPLIREVLPCGVKGPQGPFP